MAVTVNTLTPDSQVLALLCTTLALPRSELKPLSGSEWTALASAIHRSELKRPGELLGRPAGEIAEALSLGVDAADRLERLLRRGGQLAFELERLSSRGIWLVTRADDVYPQLLRGRLKHAAPAVLFGAGRLENLSRRAAAVVGSRDADQDSLEFATALGRKLAADNIAVVSGAARGVDTTAMLSAIDGGGIALGVVADALDRSIRRHDLRAHLAQGVLTLLSAFHPEARFTVANAMRRNRLIYGLAEIAFVVASAGTGGTREGALENLRAGWAPLFVRNGDAAPAGNHDLLQSGAAPVIRSDLDGDNLLERLASRAPSEQLAVVLEPPSQSARVIATDAQARSSEDAIGGMTNADAFDLVWPALADFVRVPRSEREIADHLRLELSQARAWLKRGVDGGRLERLDRPRRYQRAPEPPAELFVADS